MKAASRISFHVEYLIGASLSVTIPCLANFMPWSPLTESKRFTITEKCDKADATLKGVTTELIHQEAHSSSGETSVGGSRAYSGSTGSASHSGHVGIADSSHSTETINDVHLAVRLVDQEPAT